MRMELVKGPLAEAWGALRAGFWGTYGTVLKFEALALLFICAGITAAVLGALALWQASLPAAIALASLAMLAGLYAGSVFFSLIYSYIDARAAKKSLDFSGTLRANAIPMLWFDILGAAIYFVAFSPIIAALAYLYLSGSIGGGRLETAVAEVLFRIMISAVSAVISLFVQFAVFELLLSRAGAVGSFGRSFRLVRRNFWETVVFSIILWAVESAIAIPFTIIGIVAGLVVLLAAAGGGPVAWAILIVLAMAFIAVLGALSSTIAITARHRFWSRARKA